MSRNNDRCLHCNRELTWAEQRRQFGRVMRTGLTVEEARALLPRCQKCMTLVLEARRRASVKSV
jgi:uncharacterized protein with PIN domain